MTLAWESLASYYRRGMIATRISWHPPPLRFGTHGVGRVGGALLEALKARKVELGHHIRSLDTELNQLRARRAQSAQSLAELQRNAATEGQIIGQHQATTRSEDNKALQRSRAK